MLRKLLVGAVATAAVVAVGFSTQSANAAPPIVIQPSVGGTYLPPSFPRTYPTYPTIPTYPRPIPTYPTFPQRRDAHDFAVLVKHGHHWDQYGIYETLTQAERVERLLERRGVRARIEVIHNHR